MMHGMYGYGPIVMIIFCIILIGFGIYLLIKFANGDNKNAKNNHTIYKQKSTPLETLQLRLAKGEIDEAEYERLKNIIKRDQE